MEQVGSEAGAARSLRVLLISANTEKIPDPVFPIGAAYVAAAAERHGHSVDTLDLCFLDTGRSALEAQMRASSPDVVAISLRNLDSSAYPQNTSYIDDYKVLVDTVRALSDAPVVLGGAGFTVMPASIMEYLGADVGVVGEGEVAFPWVLDRIARRAALTPTPAFRCERVNGGVCVSTTERLRELDVVGFPSRDHFDMATYYARGGALNIQTKRGCYFECVFCSYPLIEGSRVRMRRPTSIADEIESVREEHGVRHWFFVDNIFNMPIRHCKEVCEELASRDLDIEWSAYLNPKFVDAELCRLMARSGCSAIEFGTDTGSAAMIQNLKKEFEPTDLRRASQLCHEHGLKFCHSLIFGGPGETEDTVSETIALMDEIQPTAVIAMTGIRILPGTEMVEIALRDGQLDADDNLLYPKFYIAPSLGDELIERIEGYARRHSNWIVPGKGIKTNVRVLQRLRERKIKGQLWRLLK